MVWVFLAVVCFVGAAILFWRSPQPVAEEGMPRSRLYNIARIPVAVLLLLIAFFALLATSFINPSGSQIAVFDRVYFCSPIQSGRVVALEGECGKQAEHAMPGFQIRPFVRILNKVDYFPMLDVADGNYGTLVARDGIPLEPGQVAAKPWPTIESETGDVDVDLRMLDATYFLTEGRGRKGLQTTVLKPGTYPVNPYLFDYTVGRDGVGPTQRVVEVKPGFVGVIKSAIDESEVPPFMPNAGMPTRCDEEDAKQEQDLGQIKAELVAVGCRGVWSEPLSPGKYYLNERVYEVVQVDTRIQNWTYKGGYTRRTISLKIDDQGGIEQTANSENIPTSAEDAGDVIRVIVEGWTVFVELRVQVRAQPSLAPLVVAAVGDLSAIEDRVVTPQIRSIMRNVGGSRIRVSNRVAYEIAKSELDNLKARRELLSNPAAENTSLTEQQRAEAIRQLDEQIANFAELPDPDKIIERRTEVLDFQNERATLEEIVSAQIREVGRTAGVEVVSVKIGNVDIPPELLVARQVEQLSGQLRRAYTQQQTAQVQRQTLEAAKALANQQGAIVAADVAIRVSEKKKLSQQNEGEAAKLYDLEAAEGRQALVNVLGEDRVFLTQLFEKTLETIQQNPEILTNIKLPSTVAISNGGDSGLSNIGAMLSGTKLFGGPATAAAE